MFIGITGPFFENGYVHLQYTYIKSWALNETKPVQGYMFIYINAYIYILILANTTDII